MGNPESDHNMLIRIDERTEAICEKVDAMTSRMNTDFVTQDQFWPVKTIVYSGAGLVLAGVLAAVVALVVRGGH